MLSAPTGPIPPVLPSCSSTRTRTSLSSPLHHSVPSGSDLPPVLPFPGEPRPGLSSGRCWPCAGHLQHRPARPAHAWGWLWDSRALLLPFPRAPRPCSLPVELSEVFPLCAGSFPCSCCLAWPCRALSGLLFLLPLLKYN